MSKQADATLIMLEITGSTRTKLSTLATPASNNPLKSGISVGSSDATNQALDSLPKWCDGKQIGDVFKKHNKCMSMEVTRANFTRKSAKQFIQNKYSTALKLAMQEIKDARDNGNTGNWHYGIREICKQINASHLYHEEDEKMKPSILAATVNKGIVRMSPPKAG